MVTSSKGAPQFKSGDSKAKLELHDHLSLTGQQLITGTDAHVFLACSNGLGIGIDSDSEIHFESYTQSPFSWERARLEFEPSTSELQCELVRGAISISSEGLSPRSQALIKTPNGTIRVHSASCRIEHSDTGTSIIIFEGTATYYYPNGTDREFISNTNGIRISPQSIALGQIAERLDIEAIDPKKQLFANAAHHASNRVFFRAPLAGQLAVPVLVTPSTYFEQRTARPYEYTD
ncbi:MAG: FecR domain-containing protein [Opitutaceae bacterium]